MNHINEQHPNLPNRDGKSSPHHKIINFCGQQESRKTFSPESKWVTIKGLPFFFRRRRVHSTVFPNWSPFLKQSLLSYMEKKHGFLWKNLSKPSCLRNLAIVIDGWWMLWWKNLQLWRNLGNFAKRQIWDQKSENDTRWSSTYSIVETIFLICRIFLTWPTEILPICFLVHQKTSNFVSAWNTSKNSSQFRKTPENNLYQKRIAQKIFDALLSQFPELSQPLGTQGVIECPTFERAVYKFQMNETWHLWKKSFTECIFGCRNYKNWVIYVFPGLCWRNPCKKTTFLWRFCDSMFGLASCHFKYCRETFQSD